MSAFTSTSISNSSSASSSFWSQTTTSHLLLTSLLFLVITLLTLASLILPRVYRILTSPPPSKIRNNVHQHKKGHLLIILGSGGHTAEMFSILRGLGSEYLDNRFDRRTWVVSSGDGFSSERVAGFEAELGAERWRKMAGCENGNRNVNGHGQVERKMIGRTGNHTDAQEEIGDTRYTIRTVRRARKVHQPLLTTPISSLGCLWDCICVLRGTGASAKATDSLGHGYPDLILTNGPGTGVIMVLAALLLQFLGLAPVTTRIRSSTSSEKESKTRPGGAMRSIYIESWARVKSLSLSAKILRFMASRVLVQWREVGGRDGHGVVDLTGWDGDGNGDGDIHREKEEERQRMQVRWPRKLEYVGAVIA